jgi:hypothetical protein
LPGVVGTLGCGLWFALVPRLRGDAGGWAHPFTTAGGGGLPS